MIPVPPADRAWPGLRLADVVRVLDVACIGVLVVAATAFACGVVAVIRQAEVVHELVGGVVR